MTDITSSIPFDQNFNILRKYKDLGDGTFAEIIGAVLIPNSSVLPTTIVTGQVKIATTGTAVQLPSNALVNGVIVKSISTNSTSYQTVGSSSVTNAVDGTGNGYILFPGEAASFGVANSNAVWVNGTVGDIFTYEGN